MKKLTAGIFTALLAVVATGAANAEIASKAYVDQQRDAAKTAAATALNEYKSTTDTKIGTQAYDKTTDKSLTTRIEDLEGLAGVSSVADQIVNALKEGVVTAAENGPVTVTVNNGSYLVGVNTATNTTLGVVKAGTNTTIGTDGSVNVTTTDTYDANGTIPTTGKAVANAISSVTSTAGSALQDVNDATKSETSTLTFVTGISEDSTTHNLNVTTADVNLSDYSTTTEANNLYAAKSTQTAVENTTTGLATTYGLASAALPKANATVAEGEHKVISAGDNVNANLVALDNAVGGIPSATVGEDGVYVLTATVNSGNATYYWENITRGTTTPATPAEGE